VLTQVPCPETVAFVAVLEQRASARRRKLPEPVPAWAAGSAKMPASALRSGGAYALVEPHARGFCCGRTVSACEPSLLARLLRPLLEDSPDAFDLVTIFRDKPPAAQPWRLTFACAAGLPL